MTEREAWLELAEAWRHPVPLIAYRNSRVGVRVRGTVTLGLCGRLDALPLPTEVREIMLLRLHMLAVRRRKVGYLWSISTEAGARARVRYCRQQAARLAKRESR